MTLVDSRPEEPPEVLLQQSDVSGVRVLRNTIVNGLASVGGIVVTIVLTPFMLDRLGQQSYGVWVLALMLTISAGYLTLTDLGLQQSAVRFMADARRERDLRSLSEIYSTTFTTLAAIAAVTGVVLVVVAPALVGIFVIPPSLHAAAVTTFRLISLQVLFDLPGLAPRAVLESDQRFASLRAMDLGRTIVLAVAWIGLLLAGADVRGLAAASLVVAALTTATSLALVRITERSVRISRADAHRSRLKQLMGFGSALFALRVMSVMYRNVDKVILGIAGSVVVVSEYEVANKVSAALLLLAATAGSAILPAATLLRLDRDRLRALYLRATRHAVAVLLPVCVAVFVVARPLIILWVGRSNAEAAPLVRLFTVWIALGAFDIMGTSMLIALGRLRPVVILSALWVTGNMALSAILVGPLGAPGVIWGTIISYVPLGIAYVTLCLKELNVSGGEFARTAMLPSVPGLAIQIGVSLLAMATLADTSLACQVLITSGMGIIAAYAGYLGVGMGRRERAELLGAIWRAVRHRGAWART